MRGFCNSFLRITKRLRCRHVDGRRHLYVMMLFQYWEMFWRRYNTNFYSLQQQQLQTNLMLNVKITSLLLQ